ncbi:MAG: cobalamin biosynthesis protein [Mesorhizobium sp.]
MRQAKSKKSEPGISAFGARIERSAANRLVNDALRSVSARCLTHSQKSIDVTGAASLSEAAALAVAGDSARLLGPRFVQDGVTCALAKSENDA